MTKIIRRPFGTPWSSLRTHSLCLGGRAAERGDERRRLGLGLAELAPGIGVRDDAGAGLHDRRAARDDRRADRDAEVEIAGEREVPDGPCVWPACDVFLVPDD